jgi:DNA polymerase epsilon subunit 2
VLATFIGRHCGSEWREGGLAEHVLEEVAKSWKRSGGGVIVEGESKKGERCELKEILRNLEGSMSGGRIIPGRELSRHNSSDLGDPLDKSSAARSIVRPDSLNRDDSQTSIGMSGLEVDDEMAEDTKNIRKWLKVIGAYDQPRLVYNVGKKHFDRFAILSGYFL